MLSMGSERSRRITRRVKDEQTILCAGHAFLSHLAKITPVLRATVWVVGPKRYHVSLRLKTHPHDWYIATARQMDRPRTFLRLDVAAQYAHRLSKAPTVVVEFNGVLRK
jgi:hypothetical protein